MSSGNENEIRCGVYPLKYVRIHQQERPLPDRQLKVDLTSPDGSVHNLGLKTQPGTYISGTQLFSSIPNMEAPIAKNVGITSSPSIKEVEIWVLDEAKL